MIPHTGTRASPDYIRRFCTTAEEAGLDGLWGVDHMVMPHHTDSPYVLGRSPAVIEDDAVSALLSPNYEMMTTLCWVAGFTSRIKLGTAVAVLPIRNAVANARQLSTLDVYSGGRVLYGVGVGWLREEAEAMGMPWDRRGRRSEEHIARSCARSGARTATWWSSTASSTTCRRWTRNLDRCSGRSRSSWAATPTSRSSAPVASATAGSRRRCRPRRSPSTGPRCARRRNATIVIPTRSCSWPRCARFAIRAQVDAIRRVRGRRRRSPDRRPVRAVTRRGVRRAPPVRDRSRAAVPGTLTSPG